MSISCLRSLIFSDQLGSVSPEPLDCLPCQLAKQPALPFNNSDSVSVAPFDLVHSNVWEPSPHATMSRCQYYVNFVDDYSRYTWIYIFQNRSELPQIYLDFTRMVKTQFGRTIKIFRSHNAILSWYVSTKWTC